MFETSIVVQIKKPQFPSRKIKLLYNQEFRVLITQRFISFRAILFCVPYPLPQIKCNYHTKINMHAPQKAFKLQSMSEREAKENKEPSDTKLNISLKRDFKENENVFNLSKFSFFKIPFALMRFMAKYGERRDFNNYFKLHIVYRASFEEHSRENLI